MPQNDSAVAQAARALVGALDLAETEGGDAGLLVDKRRQELVAAVRAEQDAAPTVTTEGGN